MNPTSMEERWAVERKGSIDWESILGKDDYKAEPQLVGDKTPSAAADMAKKRKLTEIEQEDILAKQFQGVSDSFLIKRIVRLKHCLLLLPPVPADMLKRNLKRHEDELERRMLQNKAHSPAPERKTKELKNDNIREAFIILTKALKEANLITMEDISRDEKRLPIAENEVWQLLVDLEIDDELIKKAYLFLVDKPDKLRALLGCPVKVRKDILMMMLP